MAEPGPRDPRAPGSSLRARIGGVRLTLVLGLACVVAGVVAALLHARTAGVVLLLLGVGLCIPLSAGRRDRRGSSYGPAGGGGSWVDGFGDGGSSGDGGGFSGGGDGGGGGGGGGG